MHSVPLWWSLRLRLPLLISSLIVVVLAAFLFTVNRVLEQALLRSGGARAHGGVRVVRRSGQDARRILGRAERSARLIDSDCRVRSSVSSRRGSALRAMADPRLPARGR